MRIYILPLLLVSPLAVEAAVYKWVDENGKVHYGDKPVTSQPSVEIQIDDTSSSPAYSGNDMSREEKRERLLQAMEEDRLEKYGVIVFDEKDDAPEFSLSDLTGKKRSLSEFKGKFIMLNFWATW